MRDPTKPQGPLSSPEPSGKDEAESRVIPVVQEEAEVSRVVEETGAAVRVQIASHEEKERISTMDIVEETIVERVPISRFVTERTPPREEGDVVIVPVFETVAVVEMRLLLKEEVRIIRRRREVPREQEVVLRKETDIVEETIVERVPISRFVTERTPPREEGDVVIVPVFETVAVVEMRLLLKEEVRIIRRRREVPREQEVVLRKEIPIVERKESEQEEWRRDPPA